MASARPIRAGKLRHYVNIEAYIVTGTGDRGQPVGSWQAQVSGVPTDIVPLRGEQVEIARQLVAKASHRIFLRYQSGVTAGMRVNYQGRFFNIGWVDEGDFRHHNMSLVCTEQTTGASPA